MPTKHILTSKINARNGPVLEKDAPSKRVKTSSTYSQSTTSRASGLPARPSDNALNPSADAPPSPSVARVFATNVPSLQCTRCDEGGAGVSPTSTAVPIRRTGTLGSEFAMPDMPDIGTPGFSAADSAEDFFLLGAKKARADKRENDDLKQKVQELQNLLEQKTSELDQKNELLDKTTETLREKDQQLEKKDYTIETIRVNYKDTHEAHKELMRRFETLEEEKDELEKQISKVEATENKIKRENQKLKEDAKGLKEDILIKESRIRELETCLGGIARTNRKINREAATVLRRRFLLEDTDDEEDSE